MPSLCSGLGKAREMSILDSKLEALLKQHGLPLDISNDVTQAFCVGYGSALGNDEGKWEYELLQDVPPYASTQLLNEYGADRWEAYHVQPYVVHDESYVYIFLKRPIKA